MITETDFPLLEWTGYALGEQPETLPIHALDEWAIQFMKQSKAFGGLLTLFDTDRYQGNTLRRNQSNTTPPFYTLSSLNQQGE